MIKSNGNFADIAWMVIAAIIFLFILPGLLAGIGTMACAYIDGLQELPPFALKAASAAVGMLVISYSTCRFLNADKGFISWPAKLTLIGIICLPLVKGAKKTFTDVLVDDAQTSIGLTHVQGAFSELSMLLMRIVPATLCTVSVVILAVGLMRLFRARGR
ncbi:hypothetical protein EXT65_21035 [Pectobacterium carotovorum subsp. carotovorum]|nr:hypothetical protein [Pectobacterium carotovorum]MCL6336281.1 hypothetical protein [Pectobacterium carotovorum subsp. carotovorum]